MTMSRMSYGPVASCVYNERYPNLNPHPDLNSYEMAANHKIEKKSNNDDSLMMIGATGLFTGLCFTALALGGTTIAPTILTVASVAVVGVGVGIAGYYAVEFVKNKFERTAPSPNPHFSAKSSVGKEVRGVSYF
jgi:hypothetical protein